MTTPTQEALESLLDAVTNPECSDLDRRLAAQDARRALVSAQQAEPREVQPLTDEQIDMIAADGMRNAAGGIYATSVYEFASAIERACATAWGLKLAGQTKEQSHGN